MTTLATEPRPYDENHENHEDDFAAWETEALLNPPSSSHLDPATAPRRRSGTGRTIFLPLEESQPDLS